MQGSSSLLVKEDDPATKSQQPTSHILHLLSLTSRHSLQAIHKPILEKIKNKTHVHAHTIKLKETEIPFYIFI